MEEDTSVVFDDDPEYTMTPRRGVATPTAPTGAFAWLINNQFAKDTQQAERILIGVAAISALLSVYFFMNSVTATPPVPHGVIQGENNVVQ